MHAKGMPQTGGRHSLIQNRKINRVNGRVTQPAQKGSQQQHAIACRLASDQSRRGKQPQRHKQHRPRSHAVYHKARRGLPQPRDHKEHGHHQPHIGKRQAKLRHKKREEWWQKQMRKMRGAVSKAYQAHHLGILLPSHGVVGC